MTVNKKDQKIEQKFYTIPLRDVVIFPKMTTTILVGREKSINTIEEAYNKKSPIFAVTQTKSDSDLFKKENLNKVGTICRILELIKTPDGNLKAILQGFVTAEIDKIIDNEQYFFSEISVIIQPKINDKDKELISLVKSCAESFSKYSQYNKKISVEILNEIAKIKTTQDILYFIAGHVNSSYQQRQVILNERDLKNKFYKLLEIIKTEIEISEAEERINRSIQEKFTKHQKEVYFNEQLKNIKKELGQDEDPDITELKNKIAKLKLSKEIRKKCDYELQKLQKMSNYSSESGVVRNYLDWIASLPWSEKSEAIHDLNNAKKILDKHHYGLAKIKERILEFIAVQIKTKGARGPILCLVGAPGVGKTSLAKSIAESLNRKYVKVSLGGVKDESEIRGHRRTYVGAMPGRIIQSMTQAGTINPLMLLD